MKSRLFFATAVLIIFFSGCGSNNPTPPAVRSMSLTSGTVKPGTQVTVSISYRVGATDVAGELESDAFSSVITIPPGAAFAPGSSFILFQSDREPDAQGTCFDGRTFLVYNFNPGELVVSEGFNPFIAVLEFGVVLQLEANKGELYANAEPQPIADPCVPTGNEESVRFGVKN